MPLSRGIEILFATHNGARTLPRMLAALRQLNRPRQPWHVLAIDNASTDGTPRLLQEAAAYLPLTILNCPEPGKMPALKLGAAHSQGALILFTDDDVEPVPQWLQAYEAVAAETPDRLGLFGGPITPAPMEDVTPWYEASSHYHAELFAHSDQPDGPVNAAVHVFGPNFLIRRAHLDVLNDVAPGLGPSFAQSRSRTFAMGEDTMIMELLARRGVEARYVRAAGVNHLVRGFQTELTFMLERAERHGRGTAIRLVEGKQRSLARRLSIVAEHASRACQRLGPGERVPTSENFNALWAGRWSRGALIGAAFGPYPKRV